MKDILLRPKTGSHIRIFLFVIVLLLTIPLSIVEIKKQQDTRSSAADVTVQPVIETQTFPAGPSSSDSDIADDSEIWFNESNPAMSVILADSKDRQVGGIATYGLDGKLIEFRQDGRIGNVDLRDRFQFGSRSIILVGGNNRSNNTIVLYELDPSTRKLTPIPGNRTTLSPNYGFCFYRSKQSGKLYAFVTQDGGATTEQHELIVSGSSINSTKVRSLNVGSQSEGCAADDELGHLYIAEEAKGLWKYGAEPSAGTTRTQIDTAANGGNVVNDLEGVTLAYGPNGTGYLFTSRQGVSEFAVYKREGNNQFVKTVAIGSGGTIDAVSSTDGISVKFANFGSSFPKGLFIAHDGSNSDGNMSNLKFVPLERIVDMGAASTGQPPTNPPPTGGPTNPPTGGATLPPNGTRLSVTILLHGIGRGGDNSNANSLGNQNPLTPQRQMTVEVYNTANTIVKTVTGTISYNPSAGNFTGSIPLGTMTNGIYQFRFNTPKYLWKRLQQIIQITNGQATTVPTFTMVAGDTDNNNVINSLDFNRLLDCFSDLKPAVNCADTTKKQMSDLTDDGHVNQFDYNLFLRELAVQCGDACDPTPTGGIPPTVQPTNTNIPTSSTSIPTDKPGQYTCAKTISPGTNIGTALSETSGVLCLRGGTYNVGRLTLNKSGAILAAVSGDRPILSGQVTISGSNITLDGINITWSSSLNSGDHMVRIMGSGITVKNGEIWGARSYAAVLVSGGSTNFKIQNMYIHDTYKANDVNQDHLIYVNEASGGIIERCLLINSPNGRGVKLGPPAGSGGPRNVTIRYNTFYNNLGPANIQMSGTTTGTIIERNILVKPATYNIAHNGLSGTNIVRNNVYWSAPSGFIESGGGIQNGGGNQSIDPKFDSSFRPLNTTAQAFGKFAP